MRYSVVIPLFNKAPYVAKAIGSVLAQTFTDYELVIMDDGSKDDSFALAQKAIEGHACCHLYRQQALSQGEYICFLDADDWWEPTFLEEMDSLIAEFPDAGVYGTSYIIVNETKHKTRVSPIGVEPGFEKGYINYCQVYAKTLAMPLTSITVAIPRTIFDEMGGFPKGIKLGEDFLLWVRIALKYKVAFLNKPLAYYNQDVAAENRGIGKLYKPQEHMLWHLDFLSEAEESNPDYKQLVDNLRTCNLLPYYLSKEYHEAALHELEKVDWERQPAEAKRQYEKPLVWARFEYAIRKLGSKLKQSLLSLKG